MAITVGLALAVLGGYGASRVLGAVRGRAASWGVAGLLLGLVLADNWVAPLPLRVLATSPPESYADLLRDKGEQPDSARSAAAPIPPPRCCWNCPSHAKIRP